MNLEKIYFWALAVLALVTAGAILLLLCSALFNLVLEVLP